MLTVPLTTHIDKLYDGTRRHSHLAGRRRELRSGSCKATATGRSGHENADGQLVSVMAIRSIVSAVSGHELRGRRKKRPQYHDLGETPPSHKKAAAIHSPVT